jgi:radical SAM superfamily enzyme YgiQ (UPF0313 family)
MSKEFALPSLSAIEREGRPHLARPLGETKPELLMVNVPCGWPPESPAEKDEFYLHRSWEEPPHGLYRVGVTAREKYGHPVMFFDAHKLGLSLTEIDQNLRAIQPKSVGLSFTSVNAPEAQAIAQLANGLGIPVILGGVDPTLNPYRALQTIEGAWAAVRGHGEVVIHPLLESLKAESPLELPGVYYPHRLSGNGFSRTDYAPQLRPDEIPLVNQTIYAEKPLSRFRTLVFGESREITQWDTYLSSGCAFECSFCASSALNGRVPKFMVPSNERIISEIQLARQCGADAFHFSDDNILVNRHQLVSLHKALGEADLLGKFVWKGLVRISTLEDLVYGKSGAETEEFLERLVETGCYSLAVGFESANKEILTRVHKDYDLARAEGLVRLLNKHKIHVKGFFIFGFPGETWEQMQETRAFVFRLQAAGMNKASFFQFKPYDGTRETNLLSQQQPQLARLLADQRFITLDGAASLSGLAQYKAVFHDRFLPDDWPSVAQVPNADVRNLILQLYREFDESEI